MACNRDFTIPTFAEVAKLIAPDDTPIWLPAHLEWSAQGVRHDLMFDGCQPTKEQSRARLVALENAARLIEREISNPAMRSLLDEAVPATRLSVSAWSLRDLASRASHSFSSPRIALAGKGKPGRGGPKFRGIYNARTVLAARIVEMWRFFRKEVPGIGNLEAAAAAQAYWLACGGRSNGYGDPLNGWYDYFKIVRDESGSPGLKQLIWWRDLEQAERRGGPPWYLGTYSPVQAGRI